MSATSVSTRLAVVSESPFPATPAQPTPATAAVGTSRAARLFEERRRASSTNSSMHSRRTVSAPQLPVATLQAMVSWDRFFNPGSRASACRTLRLYDTVLRCELQIVVADCPFDSVPVTKRRPRSIIATTKSAERSLSTCSALPHPVADASSITIDISHDDAVSMREHPEPLSFQNPLFTAAKNSLPPSLAHELCDDVARVAAVASSAKLEHHAGSNSDVDDIDCRDDDGDEWDQSADDCKVDADVSIDEMVAQLSKQASVACRPAIPHPAQRVSRRLLEQFVGTGQNIAGIIYLANLASTAPEQPEQELQLFRRDIARLNDTIDTLLVSADLGARGKNTTRLLCLHNKHILARRRLELGCPSWKQLNTDRDVQATERSVNEHPFNDDVSGVLDYAQSQLMAQFSSLIVAVNDHARPHAQDVLNMWITTWQHMFPQQQGRWLPKNV
jgi:hypothetical protein